MHARPNTKHFLSLPVPPSPHGDARPHPERFPVCSALAPPQRQSRVAADVLNSADGGEGGAQGQAGSQTAGVVGHQQNLEHQDGQQKQTARG